MKTKILSILTFLEIGTITKDEAAQQVLDLFDVDSRFDSDVFDKEWNRRKKMNWKWEYVEHGIVNRTECRRLFKKLFRQ